MGLLIKLPFLHKETEIEFYLALVLRDEKVSALIFKQQEGQITITSKREETIPNGLEQTSDEDLLQIIDTAISYAEEKLPQDTEVKNTVFGVKDSWVDEKKIKKDYLAKLKHVCNELDLSPIGFIVVSEAIAHLTKQEEGIPVTALLTEVGRDNVTVSLFKAGKLLETKEKKITETPMYSVDEALKEFQHVEILPSRIILFQSLTEKEGKKDDLSQKFIAHQWSKTLPFLQIPQISILPEGFDSKAIVAGAATQLGFTLTGLPQDAEHAEIQNIEPRGSRRKDHSDLKRHELEAETLQHDTHEPMPNEDGVFGFVLDQDIADETIHKQQADAITKDFSGDEFGEKKIASETISKEHFKLPKEEESDGYKEMNAKKTSPVLKRQNFLSYIKGFMLHLNIIPKIKLSSNKKLLMVLPVLLLLMIGLLLLYYFQLKATVTIWISPKIVEEIQKITLSTKSDNDFTKNVIAAKEITVTLKGSIDTEATGEKEVGDKAKGTITIYNSDNAKKSFKEGTVIASDKGLTFLIDKDITVASASGDIFTGIKSGTAQVSVTAKQIGTEYNLPSNSKFSIEGTDEVAAKNETAFSGGSKKKVTVVTEKDTEKLKEDLPKSLEAKAKEELRKKLGPDEELLSGFTKIELTEQNLDNDIDEEAKTVKLTGAVLFKSIAYAKNDLLKFAENSIKQRYAKEELSENIDTKLSGLKDKSETELTGIAAINAGLLPKINVRGIKNEMSGKSFTQTTGYIKNLSKQIDSVEIRLSPNLPYLPERMPQKSENISIVIKSLP